MGKVIGQRRLSLEAIGVERDQLEINGLRSYGFLHEQINLRNTVIDQLQLEIHTWEDEVQKLESMLEYGSIQQEAREADEKLANG